MESYLLRLIQLFTASRVSWTLLFLFALVMEGCALYFQYELNLKPCVNCVYERAAILGFAAVGLLGFVCCSVRLFRVVWSLGFLASSLFGLYVSIEHYDATTATGFGARCALRANFPEFLKLDEWVPWMFRPLDTCAPLDWAFLGLSMPMWLMIIFGCGTLVSLVFLISQCARIRPRFDRYYR